jgi:hypothetical protein
MELQGVHWDGRCWRVILRIDGKAKHLGCFCFGLLWNALICANYHIAWLGCPCALFLGKSWQFSTGMDEGIGGSLPRES